MLIAARTKAQAIRLSKQAGLDWTYRHITDWCSETANELELLVANEPGVWSCDLYKNGITASDFRRHV